MGFACSIASLSLLLMLLLLLCLRVLVWPDVSPLKNPHLMHCTHEHIRDAIRTKHLLFCFSNFGPNFKLFIIAARTYTHTAKCHTLSSILFAHHFLIQCAGGRARTHAHLALMYNQTNDTKLTLLGTRATSMYMYFFLSVQFSAKWGYSGEQYVFGVKSQWVGGEWATERVNAIENEREREWARVSQYTGGKKM